MSIRGMRVDPGMCFGLFGGVDDTVHGIVEECHAMGVGTLFVIAYSYVFGAYYRATAPKTWVQGASAFDFGKGDMLPKLVSAAKAKGMEVVASFWMTRYVHPEGLFAAWTAKTDTGHTYVDPNDSNRPQLSAWHPEFRAWFKTMVADCVGHTPGLAGLEGWEGAVALRGETASPMPDYSNAAKDAWKARHGTQPMKGDAFLDFRAAGMTELYGILFEEAKKTAGGKRFAVQDLAVDPAAGTLVDLRKYARMSGFSFPEVAANATHVIAELIWQQHKHEHPQEPFDPAWTGKRAADFAKGIRALHRVEPMVHVEVTPAPPGQPPKSGAVVPTGSQFREALQGAFANSAGATIYDFTQVRANPAYVAAVKEVYGIRP